MNPAEIEAILGAIAQVITVAAPLVIKAEQNAVPFAQEIYAIFTGTPVTVDDLNGLLAKTNALSAQIQAPLPPEQPDDV